MKRMSRAASVISYALVVGLVALGVSLSIDRLGGGLGTVLVTVGAGLQGKGTASADPPLNLECTGANEVLIGINNGAAVCRTLDGVRINPASLPAGLADGDDTGTDTHWNGGSGGAFSATTARTSLGVSAMAAAT